MPPKNPTKKCYCAVSTAGYILRTVPAWMQALGSLLYQKGGWASSLEPALHLPVLAVLIGAHYGGVLPAHETLSRQLWKS